MASATKSMSAQPVILRAHYIRRQLGVWGDGFVALFGVSSVFFMGLGMYGLFCGRSSPELTQIVAMAFFLGMSLAAVAMVWRCVHSMGEISIELLEEIAQRLPAANQTVTEP